MSAGRGQLDRGRQRLIMFVALALFVVGMAALPMRDGEDAAHAANKQPGQQDCGANDANRNNLLLGSGERIYPCISKVNLRVRSTGGSSPFTINRATVVADPATLKYADGTSETNLVHIQFRDFKFQDNMELSAGSPAVSSANGSATTPYKLTITPDDFAQIGGSGIDTDLWVTPSSPVSIRVLICISANANSLKSLDWFTGGLNLTGCSVDFQVRFMTIKGNGTAFPVQLPNTTMTVS